MADNDAKAPLKIDNNLLDQLGLSALPPAEKSGLLKHIYETLEMRVGMRLADQMSNEQLDEFEQYFNAQDDAGAFRWLETNFPNYKDIVAEEFEKLKSEVAATAPQILAAAQQAPQE
jgi:predicted RNA-binding Zn ribbon-like protein